MVRFCDLDINLWSNCSRAGLTFYIYLFCETLYIFYQELLKRLGFGGVASINIALTLALDVRLFN